MRIVCGSHEGIQCRSLGTSGMTYFPSTTVVNDPTGSYHLLNPTTLSGYRTTKCIVKKQFTEFTAGSGWILHYVLIGCYMCVDVRLTSGMTYFRVRSLRQSDPTGSFAEQQNSLLGLLKSESTSE